MYYLFGCFFRLPLKISWLEKWGAWGGGDIEEKRYLIR